MHLVLIKSSLLGSRSISTFSLYPHLLRIGFIHFPLCPLHAVIFFQSHFEDLEFIFWTFLSCFWRHEHVKYQWYCSYWLGVDTSPRLIIGNLAILIIFGIKLNIILPWDVFWLWKVKINQKFYNSFT